MKKSLLLASCTLLLASLFAAPKAKGPTYEPVAEGYCSWMGLTPANHIWGRHNLCASDLRHKLTVVFYLDAAKLEEQLKAIHKPTYGFNPSGTFFSGAETAVLPRDKICLVVPVGKDLPDAKAIGKIMKDNAEDLQGATFYIYGNVTGSKVPDHGGKFPFYCVFGPNPGDPLASGIWDDAAAKKLSAIKKDKKNRLENWKPYYGTVEEPTAVKNFKKLLGKPPLDPLVAACKTGITKNKDPEKAKECQILYDALEQTRSDSLFAVETFAYGCPTRAIYEAQIVMKQFPKTKAILKERLAKLMAIPDMKNLAQWFEKIKLWGAEDFTFKKPAEAKAAEAELKRMKIKCDQLVQKSKVNVVQSVAAWIANEADTLAPLMTGKVQSK